MATAQFNNPFPDSPVVVVLGPPMNNTFAVMPKGSMTVPVTPGTYVVIFTKQQKGQAIISSNDIEFLPGAVIDIGMYFPPPFPPGGDAAAGSAMQTECLVINDTPSVAKVEMTNTTYQVAIAVGKSADFRFVGESQGEFTVSIGNKTSRVTVQRHSGPLSLYLTSIFPNALHPAVRYITEEPIGSVRTGVARPTLESYV